MQEATSTRGVRIGAGFRVFACLGRMAAMLGLLLAMPTEGAANDGGWVPKKEITITAPSNPGGGWDATARLLQLVVNEDRLAPYPIEVVNRGGGGGTIGLAELVARGKGNPHELMIAGFSMTGAVLMLNSRYSLTMTTPLARLTNEYQAIAVPANSPFVTLADLVTAFKADPGSISWGGGSAGGGVDQIFLALFAEQIGVDPTKANYVAFTGGGETSAALMGGQVSAGISGYSEWGDLAEAGRIRLLAISAPDRRVDADLPTFEELGINLEFANWRGVVAPPGITEEQKQWLIRLLTEVHDSTAWRRLLEQNQLQDSFLVGDDFKDFIREDNHRTERILTRLGVGGAGAENGAVGARFFPTVIGLGLLASATLLAIPAWRRHRTSAGGVVTEGDAQPDWRRFTVASGLLLAYVLTAKWIGFAYATPVFVVAMSRLNGSRALIRDGAASVLLTLAIILIFSRLLHVEIM